MPGTPAPHPKHLFIFHSNQVWPFLIHMPGSPAPLHQLHPPAESLSALSAIIHSALDLLQCCTWISTAEHVFAQYFTVSNHPLCTWSALDLLCTVHPNNAFALHGIFIALAAIIHSALDLHCRAFAHNCALYLNNIALSAIIHSALYLLQRFTVHTLRTKYSHKIAMSAIIHSALNLHCTAFAHNCICTILHCHQSSTLHFICTALSALYWTVYIVLLEHPKSTAP